MGDRLHMHETSLMLDTYANMEMASDNNIDSEGGNGNGSVVGFNNNNIIKEDNQQSKYNEWNVDDVANFTRATELLEQKDKKH